MDEHPLTVGREWFPLAFSPVGEVTGSPAIAFQESGVPWFQDLKEWLETGSGNPRFDLLSMIRAKAVSCAKKGATALILYNSASKPDTRISWASTRRTNPKPVAIPVVYITREAKQKYLKDESASADIRIRISYYRVNTGPVITWSASWIMAPSTTVVIGTRYDNSSGLRGDDRTGPAPGRVEAARQ